MRCGVLSERRDLARGPRHAVGLVSAVSIALTATALSPRVARADEMADKSEKPAEKPEVRARRELAAFDDKPGYVQFQLKSMVGTGLRFNNPYRLATPLGKDAESVSRTPTYLDVGAAALFGGPTRFQHGAELGFSFALEGVRQAVVTPAYVVSRRKGDFAAMLRIGTPIVLTPNVTVGGELALSGTYFFRAALGIRAEMVGNLFYGAGTVERAVPAYPMVSIALGLVVAYEVLP